MLNRSRTVTFADSVPCHSVIHFDAGSSICRSPSACAMPTRTLVTDFVTENTFCALSAVVAPKYHSSASAPSRVTTRQFDLPVSARPAMRSSSLASKPAAAGVTVGQSAPGTGAGAVVVVLLGGAALAEAAGAARSSSPAHAPASRVHATRRAMATRRGAGSTGATVPVLENDFQRGVACRVDAAARTGQDPRRRPRRRRHPIDGVEGVERGPGSAAVRRRVEAAATRLGYRPDARGRALRRAESRAIGVLVPDLANPVFLGLLRGVERVAQERGYVVLIADGQRSEAVAGAALERLFDQGVDGVLLGGPVPADALRLYLDHGVPVAPAFSGAARDAGRHWERGETAATRAMAHRLVELGHRRVAFVSTPPPAGATGRSYRRGRFGALAGVLRDAGATLTGAAVDPADGEEVCRARLVAAVTDGAPTAVVCATHLLAPWTLDALHAAKRRIPHDVSLVVYGDSDWARAYVPALSVVRHDAYAEGQALAAALLDTLAGDVPVAARDAIPSEWVERASSASPPAPSGRRG